MKLHSPVSLFSGLFSLAFAIYEVYRIFFLEDLSQIPFLLLFLYWAYRGFFTAFNQKAAETEKVQSTRGKRVKKQLWGKWAPLVTWAPILLVLLVMLLPLPFSPDVSQDPIGAITFSRIHAVFIFASLLVSLLIAINIRGTYNQAMKEDADREAREAARPTPPEL